MRSLLAPRILSYFIRRQTYTPKPLSTSTTYYDSQSGLHIPVHNENEIRLFLNINKRNNNDFIPFQLYKNSDEADEISDKLRHLIKTGIHGIILPPFKFPRDLRNLQILLAIAPPNFTFIYSSGQTTSRVGKDSHDDMLLREYSSTNLSKIFRYESNDCKNNNIELKDSFQKSIEYGHHTTLMITKESMCENNDNNSDIDPIVLANNVGSIIDTKGGCDFIWISSKPNQNSLSADTMNQICEELLYLDVAGATIKSRLLIDSLHEDVVEDSMFAGVNKYVIDCEDQIEIVENVALEQGKSLVRI